MTCSPLRFTRQTGNLPAFGKWPVLISKDFFFLSFLLNYILFWGQIFADFQRAKTFPGETERVRTIRKLSGGKILGLLQERKTGVEGAKCWLQWGAASVSWLVTDLNSSRGITGALSPSADPILTQWPRRQAEINVFITNSGVSLDSLLNECSYFCKNLRDYLSVHQLVSLNSPVPDKKIHKPFWQTLVAIRSPLSILSVWNIYHNLCKALHSPQELDVFKPRAQIHTRVSIIYTQLFILLVNSGR